MKIEKIRTAVVGCGMISNIYIHNLSRLFTIIDLTTLCDVNPEAAKAKAETYGIPRTMTIDEVAAAQDIDLVVCLTGPAVHYTVIRQMLEAGKHVYTEKMFTTDLAQARELVKLADEKGLYLGVAPDTVLGAGIQTARCMIDRGMIGDVTSILMAVNRNQALNSEYFRFLRGPGGTLPYDVGVYYIGAAIALMGSVTAISAFGNPAPLHEPEVLFANAGTDAWQIPGNNTQAAALRFANGAVGSILFDGNTIAATQHAITVYGTRGILKVGDPNTFNGEVELILPENDPVKLPFTHGYDGVNRMEDFPFAYYGHRGIGVAEMAWAIRKGRKNNRCSKEYGLHCQEVLQDMDIAAETGRVYVPESACTMEGLKPGHFSSLFDRTARGDAEFSLMD